MIQQAVILAAGRGTRLGKLTQDRAKSMLPVLGKPMIARVMDRMRDAGIRRFVVVVGDSDGGIASYLSTSWHPDTSVQFVLQAVPTGTLDALLLAANYLDGPFLLSSVDNLTAPDHIANLIASYAAHSDSIAALSLVPASPDQIRASADVILEGDRVAQIEEKPETPRGNYASIMIYALSPRILELLPQVKVVKRGERDVSSGIQLAIEAGHWVGYAITDWRLHLTHPIDLLAINKQMLTEARDCHILSEIPSSIHITPPVRIDPQVSVGPGARIGPNVYLESGVTIGRNARLSNCIVLNGAAIATDEICHDMLIDRRIRVTPSES